MASRAGVIVRLHDRDAIIDVRFVAGAPDVHRLPVRGSRVIHSRRSPRSGQAWVIVLIIGVVLIRSALSLATAVARIKTTHYKVTNQRVILERGMVSKSLEEIDMRSIDDTEFHQTFLDRIFGIGEVWIVSTDKVAPRVVLHGVHEPRKTRELVRSMAYQASQRQLFTRST